MIEVIKGVPLGTTELKRLVDKQFEIGGYDTSCQKLEETNGFIKDKKKEVIWWDFYSLTPEQHEEWDRWLKTELKGKDKAIKSVQMIYSLRTNFNKKTLF